MARLSNRRIVLAARPKGAADASHFRLERVAAPELTDGHVLLQTVYLSLDPYMRGRMNDGPSYAAPAQVDGVMPGGTVSRVIESRHSGFQVGDLVLSYVGWQEYAVSDGRGLAKLGPEYPKPSYALGVLGMPGFTAYIGLLDIGEPKPGETVVVAAATGAVGSVVGQIAKVKGARAIGIAGGADKCAYATRELGFDACLDHRDPDLANTLAAAAPNGIDVYFENVGGKVLEAVWPRLNAHARVPVCGLIARYNDSTLPAGPDKSQLLLLSILTKRMRVQGFVTPDHSARMPAFLRDMPGWLREGKIKSPREDIVEGIENAPEAFLGMLEGKNFGKLIVQVSPL